MRVRCSSVPSPVITAQKSAGAMVTLPMATAMSSASRPSSPSHTSGRKGRQAETATEALAR